MWPTGATTRLLAVVNALVVLGVGVTWLLWPVPASVEPPLVSPRVGTRMAIAHGPAGLPPDDMPGSEHRHPTPVLASPHAARPDGAT